MSADAYFVKFIFDFNLVLQHGPYSLRRLMRLENLANNRPLALYFQQMEEVGEREA